MAFKDKIAKRVQEHSLQQQDNDPEKIADEPEPFVNSTFFGVEAVRNFPMCLDLRLSNGKCIAVPYSHILEISFEAGEGIEITLTTKKISITGRSLKMLYNYLVAYRVKFIQANVGNDLTEEKALFVKEISIEDIS